MEAAITKEMTIASVVNEHPEAVPIILSYGLHCVGCAVSPHETIEQGCLGHGMSTGDVDNLVADINDAVKDVQDAPVLALTQLAAAKLQEFIAMEGKPQGVRVIATTGGNRGVSYDMALEDAPNSDDDIILHRGIKLFVDPASMTLVRGCTIDFLEDSQGGGFKFNNPNQRGGCGCGKGACSSGSHAHGDAHDKESHGDTKKEGAGCGSGCGCH